MCPPVPPRALEASILHQPWPKSQPAQLLRADAAAEVGPDPTHMAPGSGHEQHPRAAATSPGKGTVSIAGTGGVKLPQTPSWEACAVLQASPLLRQETEAHRGHQVRGPP